MNDNSEFVKNRKSWIQIKSIVELSRKFIYYLNGESVSNICFREFFNSENEQQTRIYFLSNSQNKDVGIEYIDLQPNQVYEQLSGSPLFLNLPLNFTNEKQQLTKEEQLLRERKRCSFNGITSFSLDEPSGRVLFSERSEIFYFDDKIPLPEHQYPIEISTQSKGALDTQICQANPNLVSYIVNDNIWVQDLNTKQEYLLTNTQDPFKSGVPSYAVQEEFDRYSGYWWQPVKETNQDDSVTYRIVYEKTDDSQVDLTYITPSCENEFGYDTYRYPRAGTTNTKIHLKMVEITFPSSQSQDPIITRKRMSKSFYELFDWYEYLARADWSPNGQFFWAQIFDRLQLRTCTVLIPLNYFVLDDTDEESSNRMQTSTYSDDSKFVYIINEQTSDSWINYNDKMYFLNSDDHNILNFITAIDETGFLHLYNIKVSINTQDLVQVSEDVFRSKTILKTKLSDGDWSIDSDNNVSVDQQNHLVYFTGFKDPIENHLFVVDYLNPTKMKQLTPNGSFYSVSIDKKCNYFVTTFSNLSNPNKTYIYQILNQKLGIDDIFIKQIARIKNDKTLPELAILELNSYYTALSSLLNLKVDSYLLNQETDELPIIQHLFKPPQIFSFQTEDNCKLYGMIYMPFNYEHGVKYPTVLYVYAGPKFQIVTNSYKPNKYSRFNLLALLGYCVVAVDSRGSKNRGKAFERHIYKKMGQVEIDDQVKGLEAASRIFNCIDTKRVGIYGWSYGGYMSLMGLAQRPDVFKVAISGAPVTTWNLYDTAYTERYMGLPDEEKEAYALGSVLNLARKFPNEENRLLIIHGMIDENVHFAHSRKLIDALIKENKPYQLLIYPNERHGIRSSEGSVHCDTNFYSFLEQNLK